MRAHLPADLREAMPPPSGASTMASLVEVVPAAMLLLDPADLSVVAGNAEACRLLAPGGAELATAWLRVLAANQGARLAQLLRGGSAGCFEATLQPSGAPAIEAQLRARIAPVEDRPLLAVTIEDITGRKQSLAAQLAAEQDRALLLRELDHRVRNLFAVIAGLVTFSARGASNPQAMRATLLGRIDALARAHDLVRPALAGATPPGTADSTRHCTSLHMLVEALLAPFRIGGDVPRLTIEGEDVPIGGLAAPPLALALHELATNAVRHGALAEAGGRLTLRWVLDEPTGQLHLTWQEAAPGGHEAPAASPGVGQRLVTTCAQQLGGDASFNWRADGLLVSMAIPLERLLG